MGLWILWVLWMLTIIYLSLFFLKAGNLLYRFREPDSHAVNSNTEDAEGVTIIICAHNELDNLRQLLPKLYSQKYSRFEIVVVEDRSSDGSLDFLLGEKELEPRLKLVWLRHRPEHIRGKKYALTLGIRAASYNKLLLTDADCLPDSDHWIRTMMYHFDDDKEFVLGYSPYLRTKGLLNAYIRYETLLTAGMYFSAAMAGHPYMGVGRNLAYRKSFFLEKKGFYRHLHIMGGDDDLFVNGHAIAQNTAVCVDAGTHMRSKPKNSWKEYFRQKKRHLNVGKYYKKKDQQWLASISAAHLFFWLGLIVLFLGGYEPILIFAGLILKWICQFYFLKKSADRLLEPINWALLPILDFLYVIYYIILGISAISSKSTQWN